LVPSIESDRAVETESGVAPGQHGGDAGAVDELSLQEQGDYASTEDLAHVLEVTKGDNAAAHGDAIKTSELPEAKWI
jgi:hypothetical protein